MNIMIAAVGMDSGFGVGGTSQGLAFIAVFAVIGAVLFAAAGFLTRRSQDRPHSVRYTIPRL
jgi:hypothetical protein